jgi:hypothetical protein
MIMIMILSFIDANRWMTAQTDGWRISSSGSTCGTPKADWTTCQHIQLTMSVTYNYFSKPVINFIKQTYPGTVENCLPNSRQQQIFLTDWWWSQHGIGETICLTSAINDHGTRTRQLREQPVVPCHCLIDLLKQSVIHSLIDYLNSFCFVQSIFDFGIQSVSSNRRMCLFLVSFPTCN